MKILLIEDEIKLAGFVSSALKQAGHLCDHFANGAQGLEAAMIGEYDLIILDLMLPSLDGFEILRNMRSFRNITPVIILSALSDTGHIIEGLDLGAVDYIRKPFDLNELLARVRTVQRRRLDQFSPLLRIDDLQIDVLSREVSRAGQAIVLGNREFSILELLMTRANQIVTRTQILDKVWNVDFDPGSNVV
ncbi:MAG: response regulator transcription factor, partial [Bacteroidetes bacterium]|nr:response regulator transcription factor [Bacteroidota bacterium]